jgi:hypothetical protein
MPINEHQSAEEKYNSRVKYESDPSLIKEAYRIHQSGFTIFVLDIRIRV